MNNNKILYPTSSELRDVLFDSVRHTDLLCFLRSKGIFYFNSSREEAATLSSRLLFDAEALERLRQNAYRTSQKSLLSGFTLVSDSIFDLNSIYETIQKF